MEDILAAALSAIYRSVTVIIRFPIILVLVAAGIGAHMIGGLMGWLTFIAASLVTTAIFKRFLRHDIKKAAAAWVFMHLVPIAWCVVYFVNSEREPLGIGLGVGWLIGLAVISWKVASRRQVEPPEPLEPQK